MTSKSTRHAAGPPTGDVASAASHPAGGVASLVLGGVTVINIAWAIVNWIHEHQVMDRHAAVCLQIDNPQVFDDFHCIETMKRAWGK